MKTIIKYVIILILVSAIYSCRKNFNELENDNSKPSSVPPSLVLRGVLQGLYTGNGPQTTQDRQNQFFIINFRVYGYNEYWTYGDFSYITLTNVIKMDEEATKLSGSLNPYSAIAKFLKAYLFVQMTEQLGDLPLNQALQGSANKQPAYDSQKDIFIYALQKLEESNSDLKSLIDANSNSLAGDIYFNGDLTQWQKLVNTFELRVLISLSKKADDPDLKVKERFAAIITNPTQYPVMISNDDNMNYRYNGISEIYPMNPSGFDHGRYNMAETYMKLLTDLKDPRVFVVANPASAYLAPPFGTGTLQGDDFGAYKGGPSGEDINDLLRESAQGLYSYPNQKRYYSDNIGPEPGVLVSFWELCFNIAEAINRGWVAGDANAYYANGIRASMAFLGITDGAQIEITDPDNNLLVKVATVSVTDYLSQLSVQYAGNNATGLNQILIQKYLAFRQNSGYEAYYNYRRTGIPAFETGVGIGNSGVIPRRWLYPTDEAFYNAQNYKAALMSQFGSKTESVNAELWMNQ
jgi:hypothetical protein